MAEKIKLEVVTPKGAIASDDVDIVTAPGFAGEFGVLANHAPFLSTIKVGTLRYKKDGVEEELMVELRVGPQFDAVARRTAPGLISGTVLTIYRGRLPEPQPGHSIVPQ